MSQAPQVSAELLALCGRLRDQELTEDQARRLSELLVENPEARADIESNEEFKLDDAEVVILAYGSSARSARYAVNELREQGVKAGLFRPITIWPFPEKRVAELGKQAKAIVVPEMNLGQMIFEVERIVKNDCALAGVNRVDGDPITPTQIIDQVKEVL